MHGDVRLCEGDDRRDTLRLERVVMGHQDRRTGLLRCSDEEGLKTGAVVKQGGRGPTYVGQNVRSTERVLIER